MRSERFDRTVVLTLHARRRMIERGIGEDLVMDIIETGAARWKDPQHGWLYKTMPNRDGNLICVVVLLQQAVIVKTVMHHFEVEGAP